MQNQFYVYLHCRPDGTPFYVGKGCRGRSHDFTTSRSRFHRSVVAKYGREHIQVFVFPCVSNEEAIADETRHIAQLRADGFMLCNLTDGGEGAAGYRHTPEAIERMAALKRGKQPSNKGVPMTEETRAKVSAALKGKIQTAEHRAKNSEAQKGNKRLLGKKHSPETIEKRRASCTGLKRSDESRARLSAGQMGNTKTRGQKRTPEAIANMSGRPVSVETRLKISASRKRTNMLRKERSVVT